MGGQDWLAEPVLASPLPCEHTPPRPEGTCLPAPLSGRLPAACLSACPRWSSLTDGGWGAHPTPGGGAGAPSGGIKEEKAQPTSGAGAQVSVTRHVSRVLSLPPSAVGCTLAGDTARTAVHRCRERGREGRAGPRRGHEPREGGTPRLGVTEGRTGSCRDPPAVVAGVGVGRGRRRGAGRACQQANLGPGQLLAPRAQFRA